MSSQFWHFNTTRLDPVSARDSFGASPCALFRGRAGILRGSPCCLPRAIFTCIHICILHMYIYINTHMYIMHVYLHVYTYVYHTCIFTYINIWLVCTWLSLVCTCGSEWRQWWLHWLGYISICVCTLVCASLCIYTYIHIYTYIYIYLYSALPAPVYRFGVSPCYWCVPLLRALSCFFWLFVYTYIYTYMYTYMHIYIYTHTYLAECPAALLRAYAYT